jgi:hypothetical protein
MPADETYDKVHELTRKTDIRPRCHSEREGRKPFLPGYYAEDRYYQEDGRWSRIMQWIPNRMSPECQQPGEQKPDAGCVGCEELKND